MGVGEVAVVLCWVYRSGLRGAELKLLRVCIRVGVVGVKGEDFRDWGREGKCCVYGRRGKGRGVLSVVLVYFYFLLVGGWGRGGVWLCFV